MCLNRILFEKIDVKLNIMIQWGDKMTGITMELSLCFSMVNFQLKYFTRASFPVND